MLDPRSNSFTWSPGRIFYVGLAVVLLANMFSPPWTTFIHMWRVEIGSSILLCGTLLYLFLKARKSGLEIEISYDEWKFIVLPILVFILWSSLSAFWAPSWKSALHHSFIWAEYLIFYLIFRHTLERGSGFNRLLTVIVLTLVFFSLPAIIEYCAFLSYGGGTTLGMRFAKWGEQIVTIVPLLMLVVVRARDKKFIFGAAALVIMWLLIFCTVGRINYILFGSCIVAVLAPLVIFKQHRRYLPKFALLAALMIIAPIPLHLFSLLSPGGGVPIVNRLSDDQGLTSSNNFRKLMMSISKEMIQAHPIIGIGADNFGMQVNTYREKYGSENPTDPNLANAEDQIPSHAHNEFLQIAAELGIVGVGIFLWFLAGIAIMGFRALRRMRRGSLYAYAAVVGLGMFLASSAVSAYSFRVMQNGIVFFFILAVAAKLSFKRRTESSMRLPSAYAMPALAAGIIACLGLFGYSAIRLASVLLTIRAGETRTVREAMPDYDLAMRLDDENPEPRQNLGLRLFANRRYADAIPYLESAISIGRGTSADLSYLATAQSLAGDQAGAERTLSSASNLYPHSPFVLTKYAILLSNNGKIGEAYDLFGRALKIDARASRSWQVLINSGPKELSEMTARDPSMYSTVMELTPQSSLYASVTERLILHPEEQRFSLVKLPAPDE
ncbi:MAG: hypothetical protein DMF63_10830 [Acidobacteria bacterium]|nr:MAG: hypothetical protein DMF63_10830 [Acidobacteriota bacterium]